MAGNKYLERDAVSGRTREQLSADASAGAGDAGKVVALNASGEIDGSMLPSGIGANSILVVAFENLAADELVEIFDDGGTPSARKATANTANPRGAVGYADAAALAAANVLVNFEGRIGNQVGLVPGQRIYLSETAGTITTSPVTTTGAFHQFVGKATSTTEFNFEADDPIELA